MTCDNMWLINYLWPKMKDEGGKKLPTLFFIRITYLNLSLMILNEIFKLSLEIFLLFLILHWYCESTSVVGLSTVRSAYQRYLNLVHIALFSDGFVRWDLLHSSLFDSILYLPCHSAPINSCELIQESCEKLEEVIYYITYAFKK